MLFRPFLNAQAPTMIESATQAPTMKANIGSSLGASSFARVSDTPVSIWLSVFSGLGRTKLRESSGDLEPLDDSRWPGFHFYL